MCAAALFFLPLQIEFLDEIVVLIFSGVKFLTSS